MAKTDKPGKSSKVYKKGDDGKFIKGEGRPKPKTNRPSQRNGDDTQNKEDKPSSKK